jgi:hypothetical protein
MTGATLRGKKLRTKIMVQMKRVFYILMILLLLLSIVITVGIAEEDKGTNKFCITNIYPENLHPSEVSTVSITIKNIGTHSAYHVATEILVDDKSPVKVIGKAKKSVGYTTHSVGIDREVTVQYDFYIDKDAKATVYHIPMRVIWSDKLGEEGEIVKINSETLYLGIKEEILYFGIRVSGQSKEAEIDILDVTTVPAEIEPGKKASLEIKFKNIGYSTISLLNAGLYAKYPFSPLDSDLNEYINELKPDETATAHFNIAVDSTAPSSYYEIPLILKYTDEFGSHVRNTTIGIAVKGEPRIFIQEIILEPSKLTTDTEGLFMIRVINIGTESAEDAKIRISGADNILTEEHQFIGEIAPGESQTTTFGISIDEEAGIGKHGLKISISYEDKFGMSYSDSKIYELSIFAVESFIPTEYIYAIIVLIVLSIIVYVIITVRFKKEK